MKKLGSPNVGPGPSSPRPTTTTGTNVSPSSPIVGGLATAFAHSLNSFHTTTVNLGRRLSLYKERPVQYESMPLTFTEMERLVLARFPLLKLMDEATMQSLREEDVLRHYDGLALANLPLHRNEAAVGADVVRERFQDHFSHYLCRFVFCDSAEDIRFFVNGEESAVEREALLDSVDFPRRLPTNEELQKEASLLEAMTGHHSSLESFLVVPFTLVPDLVAKAQLVLRRGEAFVCKADGLSILTTLLREHLERVMETTALELANHADERLQPFVQYLGERWRQYSLTTNVLRGPARSTELADIEHLTAGDIENVSSHFPPCMRVAYERLKTDGHLKYQGRQQLTLFLKGIHLPLPEALKFWRQAFGRKHSEDVFQREYAYSIRHNYGQEGKRANYGCLPCTRIIATVPTGPLETHGCPFRTHLPSNSSDGRLEETLKAYYGLDDFEAGEMADLARRGHQQLACTKALEGATHRTDLPTVIVPTDFYFTHRSSSHSP